MKRWYETKVGQIIDEEFDGRLESLLFDVILENGIGTCRELKDGYIDEAQGNALLGDDVVKAMLKCARRICTECEQKEIITYIKVFMNGRPAVHELSLYKDDLTQNGLMELEKALDIDVEEESDYVNMYVILEEDV